MYRKITPSKADIAQSLDWYKRLGQPMEKKWVDDSDPHEAMLEAVGYYESLADGENTMAIKSKEQVYAEIDAANEHAANPQTQLEGLTVNPGVLPVSIPARARALNTVVESQEPNITKEMIMRWGAFYITRAQVITTNKPVAGSQAWLFSFHFPTHPGTWCEFFGTGDDRRDAIGRAMSGRNAEPIGPVWLKHTVTQSGNDYYFFSDTPPDAMRVNSVSVDALPIVPEETIPF